MIYKCKIYTVANSRPCETLIRNIKYAIESAELEEIIAIDEINIDEDTIVNEGITRAPVFELWSKKKLTHYHVGMLTHSEIMEIILEKVHKE